MRIPGIELDKARGERIRQLREKLHLTQTEIAEKVGVSHRTFWSWEDGAVLNRPNLRALATELHTTPEYLLDGELDGSAGRDSDSGSNGQLASREVAELRSRINDLDESLTQRLEGLELQLQSVKTLLEELALARSLPEETDRPVRDKPELPESIDFSSES